MCPISMDLMTDPVVGSDGHTYERSAIVEWLHSNRVSPLTRQAMTETDLQPNYALRSAIERWKLANEPAPSPIDIPELIEPKGITITANKNGDKLVLDINTTHTKPMETILIAVLDVSGSMDEHADNHPKPEGDQFSRLDLVKHSMLTLANLLSAEYENTQSSLGIITFSNNASIALPITKMDQVGLNLATTAIQTLKTEGATNIWDGLRVGLLQAATAIERNPNANIQLLLLTDGEPSHNLLPPLGIEKTLKRKLDTLKGKVTISTFGFGYNLDCDLLESICILGNGTYGFIPDCSMVGTVFINWASKALLTLAHHIVVKFSFGSFKVGDIILGQSQKLVVHYNTVPTAEVFYDNGQQAVVPITLGTEDDQEQDTLLLERLVEEVYGLKKYRVYDSVRTDEIMRFRSELEGIRDPSELVKDMIVDIDSEDESEGQLTKACSSHKWWSSWGRNHLLSYYHALKLQQCVNFKDKVLQHFGSDAFKQLQDKGVDIFSNLPVPTPTVRHRPTSSFWSGSAGAARMLSSPSANAPNPTVPITVFRQGADGAPLSALASMASYVSSAGPCFSGSCTTRMVDNSFKQVRDLKRGDRVWGDYEILAVLRTPVGKTVEMVCFEGGLIITPWHPMKLGYDKEWTFPSYCEIATPVYIGEYYNLVLKSGHIVELNGYPVVTLGHGFTSNDTIRHPYFGTQAVIDDLKKHPDWDKGLLNMNSNNIRRNSESGLVEHI